VIAFFIEPKRLKGT